MRRLLLTVAAASLLLSACGTTEEAAAPGAAAPSGAQITLTDGRGQEVVVDGPAERTVGLEWGVVENLVTLGVVPVGVSDVEGYSKWVQTEPLTGDVTDVGVRGEPSVDAIAALDPDLVVATTDLPEAAIAQLESIAPVLVVRPADAADGLGQMRTNLELLAQATGKEAEAQQVLADFDASLAAGAQALAGAGLTGRPFAFSDAYLEGSQVSIRPFTTGSLAESVAAELGLVNAWPMEGDPDYGLAGTDVEGLTALPADVEYVYYANAADGGDVYTDVLGGNAIWQSLPFVQSGDVTRLPDGIWMFGGPSSMTAYADAVVAALTG
ncbi:iron-siderophore ABC transporter substrate-binding protein [Pseudonocardia sp. KRD-184]|uniref:Iron-siderophore ABC transporter substrate-binding protein n=1 Tax=Pseudonocardia oceani TaxID=2792013 RepID=A0ABS6UBH0_9PSEU|nr:iron-siderophore ABC transporter substrate-binding protein [Pseudonocardia oceani]MBW0091915.1 iron-siderophore ABC transporter substrate-binding protein [Pseudonocardia oceani]MBW0097983.1 iron-siderophore ABC transporter substrate-binding protein [Pseudonocardia oceani]MBW0111503.1 iron-siderophore ABC transporter substrate-binding protein [Pseudonocardia oceani]MBW0125195.1 iron-siderophore ABC transporter substrate-binding protein [Pseudonocardia oceani]MBW0129591.1 iron-siderophore ABC